MGNRWNRKGLVFSILSASRVREKLNINLEQGSSLGLKFFLCDMIGVGTYDPPFWGLQDKCCSGLSATIDQRRKSKCKYLKPKIALKSRFGILLEMAPFSSFHKHTLRRDYSRGIQNYSFWARATAALRFWKYLERWTFEGSAMEKIKTKAKKDKDKINRDEYRRRQR